MLYTKIALGFLLALTLQGEAHVNKPGECFCGIPNRKSKNRIVGGQDADIGEYPWQVFVITTENSEQYMCGGTIVGKRHIVTAAHCVSGREKVEVLIGATDYQQPDGQERFFIESKDFRIHPGYHYEVYMDRGIYEIPVNDIAVLVLHDPLDLKQYPHIKPACLPKTGVTSEDFVGKKGTVTGWGDTKKEDTSHLQEVELNVLGQNCGEWESYMPETRFCAGVQNGRKSSCFGDSGGPLVVNDPKNNNAMTLIGVVSYGWHNCADMERPPMFADVPYFMQKDKWLAEGSGWLMTQLQDLETCDPPQAA